MTEPIILHLRSTEQAKQVTRRGALLYAAKVLRELGNPSASAQLTEHVEVLRGVPAASSGFDRDRDDEVTVVDVPISPGARRITRPYPIARAR